jgi:hypothetical protein
MKPTSSTIQSHKEETITVVSPMSREEFLVTLACRDWLVVYVCTLIWSVRLPEVSHYPDRRKNFLKRRELMKKLNACIYLVFLIMLLLMPIHVAATTIDVTVDSHAMPWIWNTTTLNSTFQFGIQDGISPTIVDSSSGLSFTPGSTFVISYVSGLTLDTGGIPSADANGLLSFPTKSSGFDLISPYTGTFFPTYYTPLVNSTDTYYLLSLLGTFADASGVIIGTPFHIGNGPFSVTVPLGAMQLQLGITDDGYWDNSGTLQLSVSGPGTPSPVPEPTTMLLVGIGLLGFGGFRKKMES